MKFAVKHSRQTLPFALGLLDIGISVAVAALSASPKCHRA